MSPSPLVCAPPPQDVRKEWRTRVILRPLRLFSSAAQARLARGKSPSPSCPAHPPPSPLPPAPLTPTRPTRPTGRTLPRFAPRPPHPTPHGRPAPSDPPQRPSHPPPPAPLAAPTAAVPHGASAPQKSPPPPTRAPDPTLPLAPPPQAARKEQSSRVSWVPPPLFSPTAQARLVRCHSPPSCPAPPAQRPPEAKGGAGGLPLRIPSLTIPTCAVPCVGRWGTIHAYSTKGHFGSYEFESSCASRMACSLE